MIYNLSNPVTVDYKQFKNIVTSPDFPWLYSKTTNIDCGEDDCELFCLLSKIIDTSGSLFNEKAISTAASAASSRFVTFSIFLVL